MTHHHGNPQHECQHIYAPAEWLTGEDGTKVYECIYCQKILVGDADVDQLPIVVPAEMELPL
jgi:hypothetical protein